MTKKDHKPNTTILPIPLPPTCKQIVLLEIKESYAFSRNLIINHKSIFLLSVAAFLTGILFAFITPNSIKIIVLEQLFDRFSEFSETNTNLMLEIFLNNVRAGVYSLLLGISIILPVLMVYLNGFIIGIFLDFMNRAAETGLIEQPFPLLLVSLMPHGIIELPVMVFFSFISTLLGVKIFLGRHFEPAESRKSFMFKILKSFVFVIIPLLFVAAVVESFVSGTLVQSSLSSSISYNTQNLNDLFIQPQEIKSLGVNVVKANSNTHDIPQDSLTLKAINYYLYDEKNYEVFKRTKPEYSAFRLYKFNYNTGIIIKLTKFKSKQDALVQQDLYKKAFTMLKNEDKAYEIDFISDNVYRVQYMGKTSYLVTGVRDDYSYSISYNGENLDIFDKLIELQISKIPHYD